MCLARLLSALVLGFLKETLNTTLEILIREILQNKLIEDDNKLLIFIPTFAYQGERVIYSPPSTSPQLILPSTVAKWHHRRIISITTSFPQSCIRWSTGLWVRSNLKKRHIVVYNMFEYIYI